MVDERELTKAIKGAYKRVPRAELRGEGVLLPKSLRDPLLEELQTTRWCVPRDDAWCHVAQQPHILVLRLVGLGLAFSIFSLQSSIAVFNRSLHAEKQNKGE
jgi:hypothetical protein